MSKKSPQESQKNIVLSKEYLAQPPRKRLRIGCISIVILSIVILIAGLFRGPDLSKLVVSNRSPSWSPDGKRIAFMSNRSGSEDIYVINADGSNETQLTSDPFQNFYILRDDIAPVWSPDGKQIAFASSKWGYVPVPDSFLFPIWRFESLGNFEISIMNVDGSNVRRLSPPNGKPFSCSYTPSWSSDRSHISCYNYIVAAETSESIAIPLQYMENPVRAPGGKQVAFVGESWDDASKTYKTYIYVINVDGSNLKQLTTGGDEAEPALSPDGSLIAYTEGANQSLKSFIYIVNINGTNLRQLTENGHEHLPAWAPDGKNIAYAGLDGIHLMEANGTNDVALTHDGSVYNLVWSPTGTQIAFEHSGFDSQKFRLTKEISVVSVDGNSKIQLTGK